MQRGGGKAQGHLLSDDICPVCKSNRYLNPKLEFFINPECYHKMCSTCVDRIFTSGPASCPVPYCAKTLRKRGFHKAFFADLKVEREVDIRRRVGAVFNRRQEEFETLLDWNNYLEEVEGFVFDLVEGSREEKLRAEERLRQYRESNSLDIEHNRQVGLEAAEVKRQRDRVEREAQRQRKQVAHQEAEQMKADIEQSRRETLERLATTDEDPAEVTARAQKVILKKSATQRQRLLSLNDETLHPPSEQLSLRGLKRKEAPVLALDYDPFGGIDFTPTRYLLQEDYDCEWLEPAKADERHLAGGYSFSDYFSRTMFEAFSGLGICIGEAEGEAFAEVVDAGCSN
ncbi:Bgt-1535 [Blumeria graminis f. sp. tritici]|uniref:RNA polymerase II transcription factor B subunit 3 n=2 Tax=Blumeria graminis f. sp. tritici TaxID=62690 RepID=A0A9X9MLK2_BLUGR|nr:Subunit of TFIIH and nucleotide excision repair factor [Blumeria graminis f. sp. tritici 96224]VDB92861.1 Bgt-1535 [Blumeria graminis f. sp. tritici]